MSAASVPAAAALTRRKPPASVRRRRLLLAVANHSLLIAASIIFLAPFGFIVLTALMTNGQALSSHLWPNPFRWQNFVDVFHQAPIWRWALNTMIYACLATLGVLVSSVPVAYALSRIRWRGRSLAFGLVLIALMLPPVVSVVPLYVMWAKLGLVGGLGDVLRRLPADLQHGAGARGRGGLPRHRRAAGVLALCRVPAARAGGRGAHQARLGRGDRGRAGGR